MKPTTVALLAAAGMILSSVSVYSLTPPGGVRGAKAEAISPVSEAGRGVAKPVANNEDDLTHFVDGRTITVEGRVGHSKMVKGANGETFVMLEVKGADGVKAKRSAPTNLAIVIDRSGSMKGTRIDNALRAATTAVRKLNDGDVVSVVTFDTQVQTVVPPTPVSSITQGRIVEAIQGIRLGGDTCISCGIEQGLSLLEQTNGKVSRMILLSDGDTNHGVRDIPGFRAIAQRASNRGVAITTIGVDVDFNEKIMTAVALESNGNHYFVANDAGLEKVFEEEAKSITTALASNAEVTIDLAPGVELERVFDRTFRRSGSRVTVQLGTFNQTDNKTVLLKVRVPARADDKAVLANVEMTYKDLVNDTEGRCGGKLGVKLVGSSSEASEIDPIVFGRIERNETVSALKDANDLFAQGKVAEAKKRLDDQNRALKSAAERARKAPPSSRAKDVDRDFERQIAAVDEANQNFQKPAEQAPAPPAAGGPFASPPPAKPMPVQQSREGKAAVKRNAEIANPFAF